MTPDQITLVQTSFRKLMPIADTVADIFYRRLFEIAPEIRPMFPDDMSAQKAKFVRMLRTVVTHLHQVETIVPAVQQLGRRHIGYGVEDGHYHAVAQALVFTLGKSLGEDFTPPVRDAWVATYMTLAREMKRAAAEVKPAAIPKAAAWAAPTKKRLLARLLG